MSGAARAQSRSSINQSASRGPLRNAAHHPKTPRRRLDFSIRHEIFLITPGEKADPGRTAGRASEEASLTILRARLPARFIYLINAGISFPETAGGPELPAFRRRGVIK